MRYKKTPLELMNVVEMFNQNRLSYMLFKCEHIFEGANKNLDVLFEKKKDYLKASRMLERYGWKLYMSEKVEKYKKMYLKMVKGMLYAIHIHREVAWHGVKALDKKSIFRKKRIMGEIVLPSYDDSLLVHISHIMFENFKISKYQGRIIKELLEKGIDWSYVNQELRKNHSKKQFYHVFNAFKKGKQPKKEYLIRGLVKKTLLSPMSWVFFKLKIFKILLRKVSLRRKGCLVALIGVNGTGKTTLVKEILEQYKQVSDFFNGQMGYYFGWEAFSFFAKIVSKIMKKGKIDVFEKVNKKQRFSLFKEMIFAYNYFEYLMRYLFEIYPKLRKGKLVVTDRYFYDLYGQYNYAPKSILVKSLFKIYPKADYLFVLDASVETIMKRDKNTVMFSKIKKDSKREVKDKGYLEEQRKRYLYLKNYFNAELINSEENLGENARRIVEKTWKRLAS